MSFGMITCNQMQRKKKIMLHDTVSFIVYIRTEDIYADIVKDVETRFDTSSYELERLSPRGKNKNVVRLMKNELSRKMLTNFPALRLKTYSYKKACPQTKT